MTARIAWACLALALLFQLLRFRQVALRDIVPVFPGGFDQTAYLAATYELAETFRVGTLRQDIDQVRSLQLPQGVLLPIAAAVAQFLDAPPRLAALDINFLLLASFEIAILGIACWLGRAALGLAMCGTLVCTGAVRHLIGGLLDFRLDFAAFCLFGTMVCLAVRAAGFHHRRWSVAVGVVAGLLVLTRSIFVVYLTAGWMLSAIAFLSQRRHDPEAWRRLGNLAIAAALAIVLACPSLIMRWSTLQAYYVIGHTSSETLIRAREAGVFTTLGHLTYYLRSAVVSHLGLPSFALWLLVAITSIGTRFTTREARPVLTWMAAMAVAIYIALTADVAKSPVVGNVFLAVALPAMLVVMPAIDVTRGWRQMMALLVFVAGQGLFAWGLARAAEPPPAADLREHARLMDTIATRSVELGLARPLVSFDEMTASSHPGVLRVMAYERLRVRIDPDGALGRVSVGLGAIDRATATAELARSDFAVIGIDRDPQAAPDPASPAAWPVNVSLRALAPDLYAQAARDMVKLDEFSYFGRRVTLFMRSRRAR